jgi:3-carboxy-cis,cis-muconate cycloisomerase
MDVAAAAPFSIARRVQAMLDVEVALAEAQAETGVIPLSSVAPIRAAARVERFDLEALTADAREAGNLLIPLVKQLTRAVAASDATAAGHVHWGGTSQDVIDTALVLQLRSAIAGITGALDQAARATAALARRHARTPMAGRTWLQQATPITFGAKAASWLDGLERAAARLAAAPADLQFGGATGTLFSAGPNGPAVARALAARLGLGLADISWHTERSRFADVACTLGLTCGVLGRIGRDLTLLAQTEIGEVTEAPAPGRGGSSSMPHKRNPVRAVHAVAAAMQAPGLVATMLSAMVQEHERAAGAWQAEWDTLPALATLTVDAAQGLADALGSLVVDEQRMRANLDAAGGVARAEGLIAALAPALGRAAALALVERACAGAIADHRALPDVAADDPQILATLGRSGIAAALDPAAFADAGALCVQRVLARWQREKE